VAARWGIAIAAAGLCLAARGEPQAALDAACELPRVAERQRTPSHACLACHDGSTGPGVAFERRSPRGAGLGASHPVEVDYAAARARAPERYVPKGLLPADVPLVDGKVACTSCHDAAASARGRVVEPARLCLACHAL
jgi:predicted CXXCH cytochrome family protein